MNDTKIILHIFSGQAARAGERARPVAISRAVLEQHFHMSLNHAAKELVRALMRVVF